MHVTDKREQILQRIRSVTHRTTEYREQDFFQLVEKQKLSASSGLRDFSDCVEEFIRQAAAAGSRIVQLDRAEDIPVWLRGMEFGNSAVVLSPQAEIHSLDWSDLQVLQSDDPTARVGIVKASLAAAETGSILQHSHAVGTGLLFLVETLVVVLDRADIHPRYEDLWNELAHFSNGPAAPRAVHVISGPSRTADVEQMIQIGAHGPREVYILILG